MHIAYMVLKYIVSYIVALLKDTFEAHTNSRSNKLVWTFVTLPGTNPVTRDDIQPSVGGTVQSA